MKEIFALSFISSILISCNPSPHSANHKPMNPDSLKRVLMQTDQAFSDLSRQKGRNASFLEYMDENVTMLQANSMPLVGKDTMSKIYASRADTGYTLTWSPMFAEISSSGDLGYTYGAWQLELKSGEKSEGTYCTIWKQDDQGNWRFVLDMGNEGLKKPEEKN